MEFWHDTEEQLRAIVNEHGLTYRFELDGEGDVITEAGFDGLTRRYQRDVAGRVIELELPTGQCTRYTYDAAGWPVEVRYYDGSWETYVYRPDGVLLEAATDTITLTFQRDISGNVLSEIQGAHTLTSEYNKRGQRTRLTSSLGADVSYQHQANGAIELIKAGAWQAQFEHNAQGLEMQRTLSGGVRTRWIHDKLGRLTEQRISTGNLGRVTERTRTYAWQPAGRLSQIEDSRFGLSRFVHDAVGNLAATTFGDGTQQLRLPDAVGNLFTTAARTDRHYGPAGQLLEVKGTRYVYDALGNLSQKTTPTGQQWHYCWNAAGLLAEVVRPDGEVVRFEYDAMGRRVSKSCKGKTTRWVWDGNVPLHEWTELALNGTNTDELITWLFETDSFAPLAKLTPQAAYSVVSDHLGTPLELHDGQGRLHWAAELDSYGAVRHRQNDVSACPFCYQGQYEDVETGLYYNRFRYYDPEAGQYISQDPIGLAGGNALYGYVSDTYRQIDVFGLSGFAPFAVGEITPFPKDIHFGQNRISPNFSSIGSQASDKIIGRSIVDVGKDIKNGAIDPNEFLISYTTDPRTGKAVTLNNRGLDALSIGERMPDHAIHVPYDKAPPLLVKDFKLRAPSKTIPVTIDKAGREVVGQVTCKH
jgi:RHS repeat-associated protein